jgi:hypothetical protein
MPSWVSVIVLIVLIVLVVTSSRGRADRTARQSGDRTAIRKGMSREAVVRIAGEPTSSMTGAELLGEFKSVVGSADAIGGVAAKEFMIFRDYPRPGLETRVTLERGRVHEVDLGSA